MTINIEKAKERARKYYTDKLPYHNFHHIEVVLENADEILSRCEERGIPIDSQIVRLALIFHDAGFAENEKKKGFSTKEAYSAHIAGEELREMGADKNLIKQVQEAILCTIKDADFPTNEMKAVRAADLASIAKGYDQFLENAIKLKKELEILTGKPITWSDWKRAVEENLSYYLAQEIRLTIANNVPPFRSNFHTHARANLDRFLKEDEPPYLD